MRNLIDQIWRGFLALVIAGVFIWTIHAIFNVAPAQGQSNMITAIQGPGGKFGAWTVQGLAAGTPIPVAPPVSNTAGAANIACNSGASPCTISNSAANVLAAGTRKGCFLQAVGVVDLYCKRATAAGSAASATNFDFIINAGSGALKGGGSWSCDSPGDVWTGAVNCIASAVSAAVDLAVAESL